MDWLQTIEASALSQFIQRSDWAYPLFETLHILGLGTLIGCALLWDLRLLGFGRSVSVAMLAPFVLGAARAGFALAVAAGLVLFVSNPVEIAQNRAFQIKLVLITLAVGNTLIFHRRYKSSGSEYPRPAQVHAVASLILWPAVVAAGRWIAYI